MISEVTESTLIIKVINEHLAESDCHHNIKSIMQEALESKSGLRPIATPEPDAVTNQRNPNSHMASNNTIRNDLSLTADYQTFSEEELVKDMSATRKAIAYYLGRLTVVEEKVDRILKESNKPKPYIERGYRA